jgi:hypothetical protein
MSACGSVRLMYVLLLSVVCSLLAVNSCEVPVKILDSYNDSLGKFEVADMGSSATTPRKISVTFDPASILPGKRALISTVNTLADTGFIEMLDSACLRIVIDRKGLSLIDFQFLVNRYELPNSRFVVWDRDPLRLDMIDSTRTDSAFFRLYKIANFPDAFLVQAWSARYVGMPQVYVLGAAALKVIDHSSGHAVFAIQWIGSANEYSYEVNWRN